MVKEIQYEPLKSGEMGQVENLVKQVFNEYIAADYSEVAVMDFNLFCTSENIQSRIIQQNHQVFVAKNQEQVVGVIETRDESHICMLFVHKQYQRKGIAKALLLMAFPYTNREITVNASPFAVIIYQKLGFTKITEEIVRNGITYIPMMREEKRNII
ncbi:MAG: GNAT family N-acetyltransferase [Vallitaleaceae bacterium]|nr:GNAT family N-acetyltransferase [Vallitaleaceae bacterium]